MKFKIESVDANSNARAGIMATDHGNIHTPVFAPVGTLGTVRGLHRRELENDLSQELILGNAYHLYMRPGLDVLEKAGGLHQFIGWDKPILTDSGGYQVYSLAENRKITNEGVSFQSHIDGSKHLFTPEKAIDIQRSIGADIIMAFDECTPFPCERDYAEKSMHLTHEWLTKCCNHFQLGEPKYQFEQTLFPIVQGSVFPDLRKQSAEFIAAQEQEGNAIGGLSVGEPHDQMYEMTEIACSVLPKDKPRYLMGVGTPQNILQAISLGVDLFDCVMPTRNGRNGMLFTSEGIINIKNEKWKNDFSPIDENCHTFVDMDYSKAYLRHLFMCNEMLGKQIASLHNLGFYKWLVTESRIQINGGNFSTWKNQIWDQLDKRL